MRRATRATIATAAIAVLAFGGGAAATAAPSIPVNNGQETTGAAGGAHGFFSYTIDGDQFCYTLEVVGLTTPTVAAHIHVGPRKVAGPVVVPLAVPNDTTFETSGCTTADPVLLAAIEENPRDYYVNVHTPTYPGGEVRGQLK